MNDIIHKMVNHFDKINCNEIEEEVKRNKATNIKIKVKNQHVEFECFQECKKRRVNRVINFIKDVVKKYKDINTTFFVNCNDWSNKEEVNLPIFVMSAHRGCKNFVIPDYLFLADYSKKSGRNRDNEPHDNIIVKHRNKIPFEEKKEKCFFRGGTSKNKVLIEMFQDDNFVDARWTKDHYLPYEDMFRQKYTISHYMKWDSIYFFLKSDILVFLYEGFQTYLWYDLFLEDNKHYISFTTKEEFYEKYNNIKNPKKIIKDSSNICDKYFTYENAIDFMGLLLKEYQKKICNSNE